ncbi:MAG: hypothetical protein Q8R38_02165 [Candidatus Omnitrophota bacterium]|nr:hypothetical protein [Candidatus Omnitrophota bacterium]
MRYAILPIIALMIGAGILYAQDDGDSGVEPGIMQTQTGSLTVGAGLTQKQVGNFSVVSAEDADVTTDGKTVYMEDIYEYVGRKFKAVEARLKKIETGQEDIKNRLKKLEDSLTKDKAASLR